MILMRWPVMHEKQKSLSDIWPIFWHFKHPESEGERKLKPNLELNDDWFKVKPLKCLHRALYGEMKIFSYHIPEKLGILSCRKSGNSQRAKTVLHFAIANTGWNKDLWLTLCLLKDGLCSRVVIIRKSF